MSLALMSSVFCDAEGVLGQLGDWIEDYNRQAPHSAHAEPVDYRAVTSASVALTPPSV